MCAVQLLRASLRQRIVAAAEDFLRRLEAPAEVPLRRLRALLAERLTEEVVALLEETVAEYEGRVDRAEREVCRQRRLLDALLKPEVRVRRAVCPTDSQQRLASKEVPSGSQERSSKLDCEPPEPPEPPSIKEEHEEVCSAQGGEQLDKSDIIKFTFTPALVKTEGEDPQSPQERQTAERGSQCHTSIKTDGDQRGASHPQSNLDPHALSKPDAESLETDVSDHNCAKPTNCALESNDPLRCSICGKRFGRKDSLQRHMMIHTGEKPFACPFCGRGFAQDGNLRQHMSVHTGEKRLSCGVCGRRFAWHKQLKKHKCGGGCASEPPPEEMEKPFRCSQCGKGFGFKENLKRHVRVHAGEKRFGCCVCGRRFTWHCELRSHECSGKQLLRDGTQAEPAAERSASGSGGPPGRGKGKGALSCATCGRGFRRKDCLERHLRVHTGERPFSCALCGRGFTQEGNLRQHMSVHTGEKRLSCGVCAQRFAWHKQLKAHKCGGGASESAEELRRRKPFDCSQCGKRYGFLDNLRRHMRVHTGERRYGCGGCGLRFLWDYQLQKHRCAAKTLPEQTL